MHRTMLFAAALLVTGLTPPARSAPDPTPIADEKKPALEKRITLDVYEADLRNVLRLLAEVSGRNLVVADEVQGKVTIRLQDVPWDDALHVILKTHDLGLVDDGLILRVAPQVVLDAEAARALELGRLHDERAPLRTKVISVHHARAKDLVPLVKRVLSPRGRVSYDERTHVLIVRDVVGAEVFGRF